VGLGHVTLRVSNLEKSATFYRTFFGKELPATRKKPERIWFQIANTRLGLEEAPNGGQPAIDHFCITVAGFQRKAVSDRLQQLGVELAPQNDEELLRFRDPNGVIVELKAAS